MSNRSLELAERFNLSEYEQELLHIPGLIQPHGIIFVLKSDNLEILQVSENVKDICGQEATSLIGKSLNTVFSPYQIKKIKQYISDQKLPYVKPLMIKQIQDHKTFYFHGIIQIRSEKLILELEQTFEKISAKPIVNLGLEQAILNIRRTTNLSEVCQKVVQEVKKISQFDRVLVYQFDFNGAGIVIAEEVEPQYESYLGLRFPYLDVPPQARKFYRENWLRLIPDVNYESVPIIPQVCPEGKEHLDLTHAILRSVSPCHIQYLKNMGVSASMSISIIDEKHLWGLVACHHYTPKFVGYDIRKSCEFLGQFLSVEIKVRQERELYQYRQKINLMQEEIRVSLSQKPSFLGDVFKNSKQQLLNIFNTEGVAFCLADKITLIGQTPSQNAIKKLIKEFLVPQQQEVFYTDHLTHHYPPAKNYKETASGILAISIFLMTTSYHIIWFRSEQCHNVKWAGDPQTVFDLNEDGTPKLCPRHSFELWHETVTEKSLPWQSIEVEAAQELRHFMLLTALEYAHFSQDLLEQAVQKANAANDAKSQFLAKMSHELRTPLNAILGFTQIMSKDHSLSVKQQEYLDIINRSGEHLLALINDVLEVSRIEAGKISLNETTFDLVRLIQSIKDMFFLKASSKGLELIVEQKKNLPRYIHGDQGKLRQIIFNLVGNAIKFTQKGYILLRISIEEISILSEKIILKIEVKDSGIGIAKEEQELIFDPFQQVHPYNDSFQGTGLGLSISRQFARLMNGDLKVKSKLNQGSTFTCEVQVAKTLQLTNNQQNNHQNIIGLEAGQPSYRILVVEDVQENQQLMMDILQSVGFEVKSANNGIEAISCWEEWQPHLIWMDMKMPILNGYEAVKMIRQKEQEKQELTSSTHSASSNMPVVVIALTATAFNEEKELILSVGCNDFVRKPCKEEIIFAKIHQYLGVRYVYEEQKEVNDSDLLNKISSVCNVHELQKMVRFMPKTWREQMFQYALSAREKQMLQLIEQIPSSYEILHQCLTDMIHNLDFEQIVNLFKVEEE